MKKLIITMIAVLATSCAATIRTTTEQGLTPAGWSDEATDPTLWKFHRESVTEKTAQGVKTHPKDAVIIKGNYVILRTEKCEYWHK